MITHGNRFAPYPILKDSGYCKKYVLEIYGIVCLNFIIALMHTCGQFSLDLLPPPKNVSNFNERNIDIFLECMADCGNTLWYISFLSCVSTDIKIYIFPTVQSKLHGQSIKGQQYTTVVTIIMILNSLAAFLWLPLYQIWIPSI